MDTLRSWLAACRPDRALLAPCCVAVGASYARFDAQQGPGLRADVLVAVAAFAAAVGVNLIDHAWDRAGAPPRVEARASAAAGVAAFALAALGGFGLVPLSGASPLGYGALAVTLGAARGAPLVGFDALGGGLGELAAFLALGPLAASAGFASRAGTGSWGAFIAGTPAGLIAVAALFRGRGMSRSLAAPEERRLAVALPLIAASAVAIAVRSGEYGPWANAAAFPLSIAAVAAWRSPAALPGANPGWAEHLVLTCSLAALCAIAVALRIPAA